MNYTIVQSTQSRRFRSQRRVCSQPGAFYDGGFDSKIGKAEHRGWRRKGTKLALQLSVHLLQVGATQPRLNPCLAQSPLYSAQRTCHPYYPSSSPLIHEICMKFRLSVVY